MIAVDGVPHSFRWHGHRYVVQRIVMQWIETGPWWKSFAQTFYRRSSTDVETSQATWHMWRIEARSMAGVVIADVAQHLTISTSDSWRLIRVID
jgi:hypothetical protein